MYFEVCIYALNQRPRCSSILHTGNFYPFENVLDTLLHELVHNEIGPHNAKFFEKWDELRAECEKLIRAGAHSKQYRALFPLFVEGPSSIESVLCHKPRRLTKPFSH